MLNWGRYFNIDCIPVSGCTEYTGLFIVTQHLATVIFSGHYTLYFIRILYTPEMYICSGHLDTPDLAF